MTAPRKRTSLLCPNCRRLVGRDVPECPSCGLKNPGSMWKDNIFTRGTEGKGGILKVILIVNIVMFALSVVIDPTRVGGPGNPFSFLSPSNNSLFVLGSTGTIPILGFGKWWTLITASFLHGSLLHILFNMIALYQLGPLVVKEYGVNRMVTIYSLSGIGGYLVSLLFSVPFTIGASAAICGLVGACLYYGKSRGGAYGNAIYSQIGGWALGIFIFGFLVPGINNFAHGGGMLTGALVAYILGYKERARESIVHSYASMVCIVGTGLALSWSLLNLLVFFIGFPR